MSIKNAKFWQQVDNSILSLKLSKILFLLLHGSTNLPILREGVEIEFIFYIILQGRRKQKPIPKSIRASHITRDMTGTCYISTIVFIQAFAKFDNFMSIFGFITTTNLYTRIFSTAQAI